MTWQAVARKDFQDASRSRWLWGLTVLFGLFLALSAYFFTTRISTQGASLSTDLYIQLFALGPSQLPGIANMLVPLVALIMTYASLIGERESGSIKLLLSLPHSRLNVVLGKAIGRSIVVSVPILVGFSLAAVIFLASDVTFQFQHFLAFTILTTVLGLVFVSIGIGFSASATSSRRTMAGAFGTYVLLTVFWQLMRRGVISATIEGTKRIPGVGEPETETLVHLSLFVKYLNPVRAYETLSASLYTSNTAGARLYGSPMGLQMLAQDMLAQNLPFFLEDWFIGLVLVAWIIVPVAVGYWIFRDADLA